MTYERSYEERTAASLATLARTAGEAREFASAFAMAVREGKPSKRLELSCLLLGFTAESLRRIAELSEQGIRPTGSPWEDNNDT